MPILGSSNSTANKGMMSKIRTNGGYSYLIELKTLWEKEKLLVTSNFSFSHNVFKSCLLLMRQNEYQWSKGLTPFSTVFQVYRQGGQCTYPWFSGVLLTSTPHNILFKLLAAFPHNHYRNDGQR